MTDKLARIIRKINLSVPHQSDVSAAMEHQLSRITHRTLAGIDVNGAPFKRKKDGSVSTLSKSGELLRSLQSSASGDGNHIQGRVVVTGRAQKYAMYVNKSRPFLGMSVSDRQDIVQGLKEAVRQRRGTA